MQITRDTLPSLTAGFQAVFASGLLTADIGDYALLERAAMDAPTTKKTETYKHHGFPSGLREWIDKRQSSGVNVYSQTVENAKYEATLELDREAVEDDNFGLFDDDIRMQARYAAMFKGEQLETLLEAGHTTLCYDGQYFSDDDHSEGDSGTQSNYDTNALSSANIKAGLAAMKVIKNDRGKKLGIVPDLLVVGPLLEWTARELLKSTEIIIAGTAGAVTERGSKNVLGDIMDLAVLPNVASYHWHMLCTKLPLKPFLWQWRVKPEFTGVTDPSDDYVFSNDALKYGIRLRAGKATRFWQLCQSHFATSA